MGRLLYNPMAVLRPGTALLVALLIVIVLTVLAVWGGVHLDGAFDLHITEARPAASVVVLESAIAWLSLGLFLFFAGRLVRGAGGAAGYFAAAGLSRFPYIIATVMISRPLLGNSVLKAMSIGENEIILRRPQELMTPAMVVAGIAMVGLIAWSVIILYLSYKEVSGLKSARAGLSFFVGILAAEVVSKLLIVRLFSAAP